FEPLPVDAALRDLRGLVLRVGDECDVGGKRDRVALHAGVTAWQRVRGRDAGLRARDTLPIEIRARKSPRTRANPTIFIHRLDARRQRPGDGDSPGDAPSKAGEILKTRHGNAPRRRAPTLRPRPASAWRATARTRGR